MRTHWHYVYDANGNQTLQRDPRLNDTLFAYDERGHRVSRTLPPHSNPGNDTETWTYDSRGRTATHGDFVGQSTRYVYDADDSSADDQPGVTGRGRLWQEERFNGAVVRRRHRVAGRRPRQ